MCQEVKTYTCTPLFVPDFVYSMQKVQFGQIWNAE